MEDNTRIKGLYSVVKLIDNTSPVSSNRLVTMTLGKYGFISSDYSGPSPKHDEFWLVRIDREIKANSLKGCFVLTPVRQVDRQDLFSLMPGCGQYTEFYESGIRYILPTDKKKYYILPLEYRKNIRDVRSVIVVNFALARFNNSDRYFLFPGEPGYNEEQSDYVDAEHTTPQHPITVPYGNYPTKTSVGAGTGAGTGTGTSTSAHTPYDGQ